MEKWEEAFRTWCSDEIAGKGSFPAPSLSFRAGYKAALAAERARLAAFVPTADQINALPDCLRRYIAAIETRCDPSGDTRELVIARDTCKALEAERARLAPVIEEAKLAYDIGYDRSRMAKVLRDAGLLTEGK